MQIPVVELETAGQAKAAEALDLIFLLRDWRYCCIFEAGTNSGIALLRIPGLDCGEAYTDECPGNRKRRAD